MGCRPCRNGSMPGIFSHAPAGLDNCVLPTVVASVFCGDCPPLSVSTWIWRASIPLFVSDQVEFALKVSTSYQSRPSPLPFSPPHTMLHGFPSAMWQAHGLLCTLSCSLICPLRAGFWVRLDSHGGLVRAVFVCTSYQFSYTSSL